MKTISKILGVDEAFLEKLDAEMAKRTGKSGVLNAVSAENKAIMERTFRALAIPMSASVDEMHAALRSAIKVNENELLKYLQTIPGETEFEKAANLAVRIGHVGKGFFLKKEYGAEILRKSKPENLLKFLNAKDVDELLAKHDVTEIFSALRFIESEEWMHETFEKAYSGFTASDFEEREIQIKVLGPEWFEVAKKFVAKKHHNVSHLKEFGVIFLNPISEDIPGKFIRDFALLLHYYHEIEFYSELFRKYVPDPNFATHLKSLLRGDVKKVNAVAEGEWLIVQQYLWKINPNDPRLFLPRVNPESMHWFRGERDLARLGEERSDLDLEMWLNRDWVSYFDGKSESLVSLDLEDNAMSQVSAAEDKKEYFSYHQREAMWTKIFMEYAGGEEAMEKLLLENFDKGVIVFDRK
jgi:hypothetical protein